MSVLFERRKSNEGFTLVELIVVLVILGLLVLAIMGPGLIKIVVAIGVALTPRIARLARGSTLVIRGKSISKRPEPWAKMTRRLCLFMSFPTFLERFWSWELSGLPLLLL